MFVVSSRNMRIRDGVGFDCEMVDLPAGQVVELKKLQFLDDKHVQCFESKEDAEQVGKPIKAKVKDQAERKAKLVEAEKGARQEEAKSAYPDVFSEEG